MKIELICTGSELLTGKTNSNATYIGSRLFAIGLELSSIISVSDRKQDLICEFKRAFKKSDVIIITGGLGPTFDDMTVEAVAESLNFKVYSDKKVLKYIEKYFSKYAINSPPKINKKQANIIRGAKVFENCLGTAPGQMLHFEFKYSAKKYRKTLFLLPGPPMEMKQMFEKHVEMFLKKYSTGIKKSVVIHIFGISESAVAEMIESVMKEIKICDLEKSVEFGILANESIIDVKFSVSGTDEVLINEITKKLKFDLCNLFKDNIFGFGNDTLASIVGQLLIKMKKTVSFAESCTGGKIASAITDVPGSSLYFKSSVVTYSNESKMKILGVKREILAKFGAVSEETGKAMAKGILKLSDSDYAFSVTGILGPSGATKKKPIGLVHICFADKDESKIESYKFNFNGTRKNISKLIINTTLDLLRRKLIMKLSKE
jgi:nicotinamide-nucleotide amidase